MTSPKILLKAWNIRAKKKLGQHFLADPSIAQMIVSRANILSKDIVVEIGAGLGALTIPLARKAEQVYAVEKDHQICELLKTELLANNIANTMIIPKDILHVDYRAIAEDDHRPMVVMGNLPYNISSQVLVQLIHSRESRTIDGNAALLRRYKNSSNDCGRCLFSNPQSGFRSFRDTI
jgi:16S rRNA (adenine1518-N6/adenine1519-N6)-dimethyltransferase